MEDKTIGKSVRRLDYETKVTGGARYLADMSVPGMCHGKILRSPYAHARIETHRYFEGRQSRRGDGGAYARRYLARHDEGIEPYYGPVFKDQTVVAVEKVRHVGDPVAALAALTVDQAEEALGLIEVDYEELPAVLDVHESLKMGATLVHDSIKLPASGFADLAEIKPIKGTNICTHFKLNRGDIAQGFAESEQIFEDTFTLPATQHCFLETHACIASIEPGGRDYGLGDDAKSFRRAHAAGEHFQSSGIQSARHRAVSGRRLWR